MINAEREREGIKNSFYFNIKKSNCIRKKIINEAHSIKKKKQLAIEQEKMQTNKK